jgi:hypothetical protein
MSRRGSSKEWFALQTRSARSLVLLAAAAALVAGCSGDDDAGPPPADAGSDRQVDASGSDGSLDASGSDGSLDGTLSDGASPDAKVDSSSSDTGADSSPGDANPSDAAREAAVDASDGAAEDAGPHSACVPGAPLDPSTDPCANVVCLQNAGFYCCNTTWDLSCADNARTLCPSQCAAPLTDDGGVTRFGGTSHAIAQITSRNGAECAVSVEGEVWCWGNEDTLGDGSEQPVPFPRKIVGLPVTTQSVAMAGAAICALGTDNAVRCWGHAPVAGSTTPIVIPPTNSEVTGATALAGDRLLGATDTSFMCALTSSGVECWGTADSTLGPLVPDPTSTPTLVNLMGVELPMSPLQAIYAGGEDTCVVAGSASIALCWGANTAGMLGHEGLGGQPTLAITCLPASAGDGGGDCDNALGGIAKLALGTSSTCVLGADHTVSCLGDNTQGQLGIGTAGGAFSFPQTISGLSASDVALGESHGCAAPLDASAPVVCWGASSDGQLGPLGPADGGVAPTPVPVSGLAGVVSLTASPGLTCALKTDGTVWCWGTNADGQLGNGSSVGSASSTPLQVPFITFP